MFRSKASGKDRDSGRTQQRETAAAIGDRIQDQRQARRQCQVLGQPFVITTLKSSRFTPVFGWVRADLPARFRLPDLLIPMSEEFLGSM